MPQYTIQTGLDNPILRKVAKPLEKFGSEAKKYEKELLKWMKKKKGVGIAAPQIGLGIRMTICSFDQKKNTTICNPEIIWFSEEKESGEEGCLSLPGVWGKVERAKKVILKYQNIKGEPIQMKLEGFAARVAQHEVDHLNGILFFDKIIDGQFEHEGEVDLKELGIT